VPFLTNVSVVCPRCWLDPLQMPRQKALETIGNTLQQQYERWQVRTPTSSQKPYT
jgi:hypothetical protein